MKKLLTLITGLALSNSAMAIAHYNCIAQINPQRSLGLSLGTDSTAPQNIELRGFISEVPFTLKPVKDAASDSRGLIRYVGKRTLQSYPRPIQQTVFLSKNPDINGNRLLEVVIGGEVISYQKYDCEKN